MRKSSFVLALVFLVVIAWFGLQSNSPRAADAKPVVQKVEYLHRGWNEVNAVWPPDAADGLKDLGDHGWELCGVIPKTSGGDADLIFKRPKQ
jgi:hypothetical protein